MRRLVLFFAAVAMCMSCANDDTAVEPIVPSPHLSDIQQVIFTPSCSTNTSCHNSTGRAGMLDLTAGRSFTELTQRKGFYSEVPVVLPGRPEASFLVKKLRGMLGPNQGEQMPLRDTPLGEEQIQAIEAWIRAGAPND